MTKSEYLIVDKRILPAYFDKVIEARAMVADGRAKDVSEAVKAVNISRSTYYKYKDYVFAPNTDTQCHKAVISFSLLHSQGLLGKVLETVSAAKASILTISQNLPINNRAHVVFSADISAMTVTINQLIDNISAQHGVSNARLVAVE